MCTPSTMCFDYLFFGCWGVESHRCTKDHEHPLRILRLLYRMLARLLQFSNFFFLRLHNQTHIIMCCRKIESSHAPCVANWRCRFRFTLVLTLPSQWSFLFVCLSESPNHQLSQEFMNSYEWCAVIGCPGSARHDGAPDPSKFRQITKTSCGEESLAPDGKKNIFGHGCLSR